MDGELRASRSQPATGVAEPETWPASLRPGLTITPTRLITANESSAVNPAVAFYHYTIGIPTGQEPPLAR